MKDGGMIMEPDETLFVDNGHRHAVTVAVSSVSHALHPVSSLPSLHSPRSGKGGNRPGERVARAEGR